MFKKSIKLFFIEPLTNIFISIKGYLVFLFHFLKENITLNFEPKNVEEDLKISAKIFQIIVLIIIINLSIKEIFDEKDSNLLTEIGQEIAIGFFYWLSFLIIYYFGIVFNKIYKSELFTTFSVKMWNFYALVLVLISMLTDNLSSDPNVYLIIYLWLFIIVHLLLYYFKLIKRGLLLKKQFVFIFILSILLISEIFLFSIVCNLPFLKK
jgi:hypothetical protein